jgi:protein-disulfide isomerase
MRAVLDITATIVAIGVACHLGWSAINRYSVNGKPPPAERVAHDANTIEIDTVTTGATVALVEFSDFQCPYCGQYARTISPQIRRDYADSGRIAYVVREYPLQRIHPWAFKAAEAAECAARQGRYWDMYDVLFANQRALGKEHLGEFAGDLGLQSDAFDECMNGAMVDTIRVHQAQGRSLNIAGTPTFLVGRIHSNRQTVTVVHKITGAQPYRAFKDAIESLIGSDTKTLSVAPRSRNGQARSQKAGEERPR